MEDIAKERKSHDFRSTKGPLTEHPFFGMLADEAEEKSVLEMLKDLRKPRY